MGQAVAAEEAAAADGSHAFDQLALLSVVEFAELRERAAQPDSADRSLDQVNGDKPRGIPPVPQLLARRSGQIPVTSLTEREREVLALMAEGRSNSAIAQRLFVSGKTVTKHSTNIFAKLGLPPSEDDNRRVLAVPAYLNA